jgi:hypothetical protein
MPVEAFAKRRFGTDDGRKETNERKCRRRNADRRKALLPWLTATAAPLSGEAHIYRRSTAVLAPRSLSSQGTQPRARLPGTRRGHVLRIPLSGITRPGLSQSSDSTSRSGPSAGEHDAQDRPGAGCKPARGHRTRPRDPGIASRAASDKSEIRSLCNIIGDDCQPKRDRKETNYFQTSSGGSRFASVQSQSNVSFVAAPGRRPR